MIVLIQYNHQVLFQHFHQLFQYHLYNVELDLIEVQLFLLHINVLILMKQQKINQFHHHLNETIQVHQFDLIIQLKLIIYHYMQIVNFLQVVMHVMYLDDEVLK